jgi:hypothetical protein
LDTGFFLNFETMFAAVMAGMLAGFGVYWGQVLARLIHGAYHRFREKAKGIVSNNK